MGGGGGAGGAVPSVWRAKSFAAACRDAHIIVIVDARANARVGETPGLVWPPSGDNAPNHAPTRRSRRVIRVYPRDGLRPPDDCLPRGQRSRVPWT